MHKVTTWRAPSRAAAAAIALLAVTGCSSDSPTAPQVTAASPGALRSFTTTWQSSTAMLEAASNVGGAAINGLIYAATSHAAHLGESPTLQVFDPATGSWTYRTPMTFMRHAYASAELNGKLYIAAGDAGQPHLEAYDPATDSWTTLQPIPHPRRLAAGASAGGLLYVIGGCGSSGPCDKVQAYDPVTDQWSMRAALNVGRNYIGAAAIDGIVYAVGGYATSADPGSPAAPSNALEAYDPQTNAWTLKAPMPTARIGAMTAVLDGKLYVISGHDGAASWLDVVEVYDPATDTWSAGPLLPSSRFYAGTAVLNGELHVFGGYGPNGSSAAHDVLVKAVPTRKDQCKKDGWRNHGFRNQGQCVRYVETGKSE